MTLIQNPHFTLLLTSLLLTSTLTATTTTLNITQILSHHPTLSIFTTLLTTSNILPSLPPSTPLTILAIPNSHLTPLPSLSPTTLSTTLRRHILLQYLTLPTLLSTPPSGTLITTLQSPLTITFNTSTNTISFHPTFNTSITSTLLSPLASIPSLYSVLVVDSLIYSKPYDDLTTSSNNNNKISPSTLPAVNITQALINGHEINIASSMLFASGVISEFQADENGAGITLFIPIDDAFSNLPSNINLKALSADRKSLVLKFHVLHSYYPLGSLESIVNPVQPTLATEDSGAGSFTLNISRINGSVSINSGIIQAVVSQTVFDQNPVSIFGVSRVLLPKEIFGGSKFSGPLMGGQAQAQPPEVGPGPEGSYDGLVFREGVASQGWRWRGRGRWRWRWVVVCIALLCHVCNDVIS